DYLIQTGIEDCAFEMFDGQVAVGADLEAMVREARTIRQPIQQITRKVGSKSLVEQPAIAGMLNLGVLSDAQQAGAAAAYMAQRLDALTQEGDRGWTASA